MLAILSLVLLPFLKPAWTSESSWFALCWSLACKVLSVTLPAWEMSMTVRWLACSLVLPFLGTGMRIDLFQFCGHCWIFQICWHNECKILMALSFRDLNSSAGVSLHSLALLTKVLLKAHLTSHSVCLWVTNHTIIVTGSLRSFLYSSSMYSFHLILISSASTRSLPFLSFLVSIFGQNAPLMFSTFLKRSLVLPFYCFLLLLSTVDWRSAFCLFYLFFGTVHLIECIFPSLPCFSLHFILPLFIKPPQITTLRSCFSFSVDGFVCHLLYNIMDSCP